MSKMDELRALREARYEQSVARAAAHRGSSTPSSPAPPAARPAARSVTADPPATAEPESRPCGHRSINGRTCTREHGHAAKSHRYS